MPAPVCRERREQIVALRKKSYKISEIAKLTQVSRKCIYFWIKRWKKSGHLSAQRRQVYQRATTAEQDQEIIATHEANPLHSTVITSAKYNISTDTVRRRLKSAGLRCLTSAYKLPPTDHQQNKNMLGASGAPPHVAEKKELMMSGMEVAGVGGPASERTSPTSRDTSQEEIAPSELFVKTETQLSEPVGEVRAEGEAVDCVAGGGGRPGTCAVGTGATTSRTELKDLDKFKRRLIHTVARLLYKEKLPQDEVWTTLKKDTGRDDCDLLWQRMRLLTVKKLRRLLAADDYVGRVSKVARMTRTDWLMFDAALAHDHLDLLTLEVNNENRDRDPNKLTALSDLFELVKEYEIEDVPNERLAQTWTSLTIAYNNNSGRVVSPMLLQKRWFLLKEQTRRSFYGFWSMYRGNRKRYGEVQDMAPTKLQRDIANQYAFVIVQPFQSWEERVKEGTVAVLEDFSRIRVSSLHGGRAPGAQTTPRDQHTSTADEQEPDVVILEQKIDTITLDDESGDEGQKEEMKPTDFENSKQNMSNTNEISVLSPSITNKEYVVNTEEQLLMTVKKERIDPQEMFSEDIDGLSNVRILEATHVPTEEIDDYDDENEMPQQIDTMKETKAATQLLLDSYTDDTLIEKTENVLIEDTLDTCITKPDIETKQADNVTDGASMTISNQSESDVVPETSYVSPVKETRKEPQEESFTTSEPKNSNFEQISNNIEEIDDLENDPLIRVLDNNEDCFLKSESHSYIETNKEENDIKNIDQIRGELPVNLEFIDDGIEFIEDNTDDDDNKYCENVSTKGDFESPEIKKEFDLNEDPNPDDDGNEAPKFDLKLLMCPVVYTKKLDHMKFFKDTNYENVKSDPLINLIDKESKPFSSKSINLKPDSKKPEQEPVVPIVNNEERVGEDLIRLTPHNDGVNSPACSDIPDSCRINPISSIFRKPRKRSYNLIQLCKNPDFNTRLKRLSAGFLTLQSNRQYLKACKPLTIDLHKDFETKLIDNTVYLKSGLSKITQAGKSSTPKEIKTTTNLFVTPSAIPAQCLMDSTLSYNDDSFQKSLSDDMNTKQNYEHTQFVETNKSSANTESKKYFLASEGPPITVKNNESGHCMLEITPLTHRNNYDDSSKHLGQNTDLPSHESAASDLTSSLTLSNPNQTLQKPHDNEKTGRKNLKKPDKISKLPKKRPWYVTQNKVPRQNLWYRPNPYYNSKCDNTLLTYDTLVKMLNLISGTDQDTGKSKKNKSSAGKQCMRKTKVTTSTQTTTSSSLNDSITVPNSEERNIPKPVIGLQSKKNPRVRNRKKPCCWAKEAIEHLKKHESDIDFDGSVPEHRCLKTGTKCGCCCRKHLFKFLDNNKSERFDIKANETSENNTPVDISPPIDTLPVVVISEKSDSPVILIDSDVDSSVVINDDSNTSSKYALTEHTYSTQSNKHVDHNLTICKSIAEECPPSDECDTNENGINLNSETLPDDVGSENILESNKIQLKENDYHISVHTHREFIDSGCTDIIHKAVEDHAITTEVQECTIQSSATEDSICSNKRENMAGVINNNSTIKIYKHYSILSEPVSIHINEVAKEPVKEITTPNISSESEQFIYVSDEESDTSNVNKTIESVPLPRPLFETRTADSHIPDKNSGKKSWKTKFVIKCSKTQLHKCPLILGKNKILLTTAHIPQEVLSSTEPIVKNVTGKLSGALSKANSKELKIMSMPEINALNFLSTPDKELNVDATINSNVSLPEGVQLVLTSTGELSCVFSNPDVLLNDSQLLDLQNILNEVQLQLNNRLVPEKGLNNDDVTVLTDDETDTPTSCIKTTGESNNECHSTNNSSEKHKLTNTTHRDDENCGLMDQCTENIDLTSKKCDKAGLIASELDNLNNIKDSGPKQAENQPLFSEKDCTNIREKNTNINEKDCAEENNLLKCTEEFSESYENSSQIVNKNACDGVKKSILSDLMEMSGILPEDVLPSSDLTNTDKQPKAANILPELTQITNLTTLRYAYEQKGDFYKFDLMTGNVVPIKISIQTSKKKQIFASGLQDQPVIDLTDTQSESPKLPRLLPKPLNTSIATSRGRGRGRPRGRPPIGPSLLRRHENVMPVKKIYSKREDIRFSAQKNMNERKEKLNPKPIEDSDMNMEEEYLIDESSCDSLIEKSIVKERNFYKTSKKPFEIETSDSSDDEPLAKKVKRKIETEAVLQTQNPDNDLDHIESIEENINEVVPLSVTAADLMNVEALEDDSDDFILGA